MGRTQRRRYQRKKLLAESGIEDNKNVFTELLRHLVAKGWYNETQLKARNFPYMGRGLCSKINGFQSGDELIRLPLDCLITIKTLEEDSAFKTNFILENCTSSEQRTSFQSLLSCYLLYQKHLGEQSHIYAYLNTIPAKFTTPYFCALSELQFLPEFVLEQTVAQNRKIRQSYGNLKILIGADQNCGCCGKKYFDEIYSLDAYKWAWFAVNSRSVYLQAAQFKPSNSFFQQLLSDEVNLGLAPFLDLFNHADFVTTKADLVAIDTSSESNLYEYVVTLQDADQHYKKYIFAPYEQIFISYGPLTNFKLFVDYGFVLKRNKFDYFEFKLSDIENFTRTQRDFVFHSNKFKFIRDHNLDDQMFVHLDEAISHNLHVVLHLLFMEKSHFPNVLNQVAFGEVSQLKCVQHIVEQLIAFKVSEYELYINDMRMLPVLSDSGKVAIEYMLECIWYLRQF